MARADANMGVYAFAAAVFFAGAAQADTFTPAPNASYALDLDTQAGAFSQWRLTDLSSFNALRGRVTFLRKGSDRQWPPVFRVALGDDQQQAWLQIIALPHSGPLIVRVYRQEGQTESDVQYFTLPPSFREPFELRIDWTGDGRVTFLVSSQAAAAPSVDVAPLRGVRTQQPESAAQVGLERHEVLLGRAPAWLLIDNSTGEVMVDPLQLGWAQR